MSTAKRRLSDSRIYRSGHVKEDQLCDITSNAPLCMVRTSRVLEPHDMMSRIDARPPHVWQQRISLGDLDWHGHVNNVRMIAWIHDAWADLLGSDAGPLPSFVTISHEARYLTPLLYGSSVEIRTVVSEIGRSAVKGTATIVDDAHRFAEITTTWVAFDIEKRCARPMTETERAHFSCYMNADPSRAKAP